MKRILSVLLLFSIVLINPSCKKEYETDAELLAEKLQNVIKTENVERLLWSSSGISDPANAVIYGDWGKNYRFDPPLVTIEGKVLNLTSMKSYQIVTISSYK